MVNWIKMVVRNIMKCDKGMALYFWLWRRWYKKKKVGGFWWRLWSFFFFLLSAGKHFKRKNYALMRRHLYQSMLMLVQSYKPFREGVKACGYNIIKR